MGALHALRREEQGLTLVELLTAMFVAALAVAVLAVWVSTVFRANLSQEQDFEVLNEMRFAKAEMVREIRFATAVLPTTTPNTIDIWIDRDGSGGSGPDQPGEQVTWQVVGTTLVRYEDADATATRVLVENLVVGATNISVSGNLATIQLTADVDPSIPPDARTIKTQVHLRNL